MLIVRKAINNSSPYQLSQLSLTFVIALNWFVYNDLTNSMRGPSRKHPIDRMSFACSNYRQRNDWSSNFACHFIHAVLEREKTTVSRPCSFWKRAQMNSILISKRCYLVNPQIVFLLWHMFCHWNLYFVYKIEWSYLQSLHAFFQCHYLTFSTRSIYHDMATDRNSLT